MQIQVGRDSFLKLFLNVLILVMYLIFVLSKDVLSSLSPQRGGGLVKDFSNCFAINKTFFRIQLIVWANFIFKTVIIINITPSLPIKFWGMGVIL